MTTYTTLSNALVAVGAKPFATTVQAFRDNPIAIAEGDVSAPVNSPAWHPYNMVTGNDGATGLFYDFAVNGAQSSITTPTFVDGYDYLIRWVGLSPSAGAAFRIAGVNVSAAVTAGNSLTGFLEIIAPTLTNWPKIGRVHFRETAGAAGIANHNGAAATPLNTDFAFASMGSGLTSITFDYGGGINIDAGQAFLYRRRNYMGG